MSIINSLYGIEWQKRFRNIARKKYSRFSDWEDIFEECLQETAINLSNAIQNRNVAETDISDALITTTFIHAMTSRQRREYGYLRARTWLEEFGELGKQLFEWVCKQKLEREQIMGYLQRQYKGEELSQAIKTTTAIVNQMMRKDECSSRPQSISMQQQDDDQGGVLEDRLASNAIQPQQQLDEANTLFLTELLFGESGQTGSRKAASAALVAMAEDDEFRALLSNSDRLILKLYYQEGRAEREVADFMGISHSKARRKRQAVLIELQRWLSRYDIAY